MQTMLLLRFAVKFPTQLLYLIISNLAYNFIIIGTHLIKIHIVIQEAICIKKIKIVICGRNGN